MITATAPLQMIRAEISVNHFHRWMGGKRLTDPDHTMHCLLTEGFGGQAPKPFRLITPRDQSTGFLYGYGTADAEALRETAAICADLLQCRVIPLGKLDSKPMPSDWPAGKRLGFEVRIRPMIRKTRGTGRHYAEQDAFQDQAEGFPKNEMPNSREKVYANGCAVNLLESAALIWTQSRPVWCRSSASAPFASATPDMSKAPTP